MRNPSPFDPPARRRHVRITSVYSIDGVGADHSAGKPSEFLRLGRLSGFYDHGADQLPQVVGRENLGLARLQFERWQDTGAIVAAVAWMFVMPSGQHVAAVTFDVKTPRAKTIDLLEDCYYGTISIDGAPLAGLFASMTGRPAGDPAALAPERHQIIFDGPDEQASPGKDDQVQRLIYRTDLPYRPEFSSIVYPLEMNRRPGSLAAVGPYVSVVIGQQDYVENTVFLSVVQAVASAARLRMLQARTHRAMRIYRSATDAAHGTPRRRRDLERLSDRLGDLELDLSFGVEAGSEIGLIVPSLRTESYHRSLCEAMDLLNRAHVVEQMLKRLERTVASEIRAIESVERRSDDQKRLRWGVAVGLLSATAVPLGLVFAFFGMNTTDVGLDRSMFDPRYVEFYIAVAVLPLLAGIAFVLLWAGARRRELAHRRPGLDL